MGRGDATLQLAISGYHATWQPTEQIPERVIGSSVCENVFCALDPTAEGETLRYYAGRKPIASR